jgi:valyl-tRNA synthetase
MPFVTEELWQQLPHAGEALIIAEWPEPGDRFAGDAQAFESLKDIVRQIRNARSEHAVDPVRRVPAVIFAGGRGDMLQLMRGELEFLARLDPDAVEFREGDPVAPGRSVSIVSGGISVFLPLAGLIDLDAERRRIEGEMEAARAEVSRASAMLDNAQFVARAPAAVVDGHRNRRAAAQERLALLEQRLRDLDD